MADNLLRLKVDSQEYDAKIKRAAEGIQHFVENVRESGSTLQESGILARSFLMELGNMETVAKGGKQQLREMSNALVTLTNTYRGLSTEEKSSGFGQELAKQIQILTERAGQSKDAMEDVAQSIKNAASDTRAFDQMAQAASVATAGFQGLVGAGKMLGFEMGNDVEVIAKLQSAMAVTNSLTTIQTALQKQSALMQGVQAAQTALATAAQTAFSAATGNATIAQAAFNAVANMNPYVLLATAAAAAGAALIAFSSNSNKAEAAQRALNAELDNTKSQLAQIDKDTDFSVGIMEAAGKSWKAIHAVRLEAARTKLQLADMNYDKLAESGASKEQMQEAANIQQQAWDNVMKVLNEGTIHWAKEFYGKGKGGSGSGRGSSTPKEDANYAADSIMAQEKEVQRLTDLWNRASSALREGYLQQLDAAKAKLDAMKNESKALEGGMLQGEVVATGSKMVSVNKAFREGPLNFESINTYISGVKDSLKNADLGTPLYESLTEKLRDATTMSTLLQELMERGVDGADLENVAKIMQTKLLSPDGIDQDGLQQWLDAVNKGIEEAGGIGLAVNTKTGEIENKPKSETGIEKAYKDFDNKANQFIGGLSSVAGGLKNMGIEIPKEVNELTGFLNGFMQIISGFQSLISLVSTPAQIANTTAIANLTAILTAKMFVPGLQNGGIIPHAANGYFVGGTHMSGDVTPIMANEGELVLNKSQQFNLAAALSSNDVGQGYPEVRFSGEDLFVVLNNYLQRAGYGEILTSKG